MEVNTGSIGPQPERLVAAEEMDFVPASHEVARELRGDDAAPAERGVADDADLQRRLRGHG
jgi:hypothetical protein